MSTPERIPIYDYPEETLRAIGWVTMFGWTPRSYYLGPYLRLHRSRPSVEFTERIMECVRLTLRCMWQNFNGCQWSLPTLRTYIGVLRGKININS